jgi:mannose-6-phosphate isomerase-like protein (cupin superfamily)
MARAGDMIESPVIGERVIFRKTAADTNGEVLEVECISSAGSSGPVEHIHLEQDERFAVLSGVMLVQIAGREERLEAGQEIVIPRGKSHTFRNGGSEDLHFVAEFRPALQTERFFETMFGLARDGKTDAAGSPRFLQIMLMTTAYDIYIPGPPIVVQRLMSAVLSPIAKLLGYRASYPQYSESQYPNNPAVANG